MPRVLFWNWFPTTLNKRFKSWNVDMQYISHNSGIICICGSQKQKIPTCFPVTGQAVFAWNCHHEIPNICCNEKRAAGFVWHTPMWKLEFNKGPAKMRCRVWSVRMVIRRVVVSVFKWIIRYLAACDTSGVTLGGWRFHHDGNKDKVGDCESVPIGLLVYSVRVRSHWYQRRWGSSIAEMKLYKNGTNNEMIECIRRLFEAAIFIIGSFFSPNKKRFTVQ